MTKLLNARAPRSSLRRTGTLLRSGPGSCGTSRYFQTLAGAWSGVKNPGGSCGKTNPEAKSAANTDFAETEQDAPAVHRAPEAQLRTEAREQEELIDLPLDGGIVRSR